MLTRIKVLIAVPLLVLVTLFQVIAVTDLWTAFADNCPNVDVLSWDANLRYRDVIDLYQDINNGQYFEPIMYVLRSPTWPTLRQQIALFVYSFVTEGPHTITDVKISFVFFCLMFLSLLIIALDITRDWLRAAIAWLFSSALILYSREMPVYGLSSMLETQGMFFLLWTSYFLYKLYEQQRWRRFFHTPGMAVPMHKRKRYFFGLLFSSAGLFHTKYPYGLMLVLSIVAFELIRHPQRFLDFFVFSFKQHYQGVRRWIIYVLAGFALLLVLGVLLPQIGLELPFKPRSKFLRLVIWLLALGLFIDLNLYIWRLRVELAQLFDTAFRQIYFGCILPTIGWLILLPDRMGSIIGTQQHTQDAAQSFSAKLFQEVFHREEPFLLILVLAGISLLVLGLVQWKRTGIKNAFQDFFSRPLIAVLGILVIQFVILEVLTGNKQLRHIYHILPVFILLVCIMAMRLPRYLKFNDSRWSLAVYMVTRLSYIVIPLSVFLSLPGTAEWRSQAHANQAQEGDIFTVIKSNMHYMQGRKKCYTGENPELFEPVRWFVEKVPADKNYIFINNFHNEALQHPGRLLASDFDVLLRSRTLQHGSVRNDNDYLIESWLLMWPW